MAIAPRPVVGGIDAPVVGLMAAGPPAFELSAAVCAIARVPVSANAAANARVLSFMGGFLLDFSPKRKTTIGKKVPVARGPLLPHADHADHGRLRIGPPAGRGHAIGLQKFPHCCG